jgi:uncharacterized protein YndB with AHSA1/START domain
MKQLHFSISISAPRENVWNTMLSSETYKVWTEPFCEGSYFQGSWEKGERIRFLAPNGSGMTSEVAESRPYEYISIRHLGYINDGVEDTESQQVRSWAPAYENYTFLANGNVTDVQVDLDITPEFEKYMLETWPKALSKLKALCEGGAGSHSAA